MMKLETFQNGNSKLESQKRNLQNNKQVTTNIQVNLSCQHKRYCAKLREKIYVDTNDADVLDSKLLLFEVITILSSLILCKFFRRSYLEVFSI